MLKWHTNSTSMIAEALGCSYVIRAKLTLDGYTVDAIRRHDGVTILGTYGTTAEAMAIAEIHHCTIVAVDAARPDDPHDPVA